MLLFMGQSVQISGRSLFKGGVADYWQSKRNSITQRVPQGNKSLKNRIDASTLRPHEPITRASPNTESILGRGNPPFTAQQLVLAETHTCYARDTSLTCTSIDKCSPCCRTGNKAAHWRMERTKGRRNRSTCECHLSNRWTCPQACPLHSS